MRELILRLAIENPRWGCVRDPEGELRGLGIRRGATTIRSLLKRNGLGPAPQTTRPLLVTVPSAAQAQGVLACDFFSVETAFLQTLYVLFFIEVGTRPGARDDLDPQPRGHLRHPTGSETSTWQDLSESKNET